jgi:hypothetical protein
MCFFRRFENARFPQENEKNNRATMISVRLIIVALRSVRDFAGAGAEAAVRRAGPGGLKIA